MSLAEYVLDDLKKVTLRTPCLTSLFATISTRKTTKQEARQRSVGFVMDVNSRITDIFIYGEGSPAVLADLESRRQALYLYWSFHDCKVDVPLSEKEAPWLRAILKQCYDTLLRFEIRDMVITDKDWDELLDGYFNISRLTDFKIAQKNDMSVATMQKIVVTFPEDSSHVHTIILDEHGGVSADDAKPIRAQLRRKTELRSHRGFISINA
ncbi:hypothetical protein BG000_011139 [Podila horticola]|nr:hypothetical protein BG000_011139 [Podila horticola]